MVSAPVPHYCAATPTPTPSVAKNGGKARVLVLGGTGRVGGSTATALSKLCPSLHILVAGRNRVKGEALVSTLGRNSQFVEVDIDNASALEAALTGVDLVVHAAGPFQQEKNCKVLAAAISTKTAYVDVCDDTNYAMQAKSYHKEALSASVPAITTGGIYPGVSNVMAAELVRIARSESAGEPERLRFFYYTAGTGGAGPTILATSFLLLGEDVVAYNKGEKIKLKPYSGMLNIDFGRGVGKRDVYLLNLPEVRSAHEILGVPTVSARFDGTCKIRHDIRNLPEVRSAHEILGVPTVSARFGTAPFFWNWGMEAVVNFVPADTLRDRSKVQGLVKLFDPFVRAFDGIAGERVSMRVDLECSNGRTTLGLFTHRRLSVSVGIATAAFALAILEGSTQPGVWFPEEPEGIPVEARALLLERAAQGTINFVMNKPPWMVETDPKEVGLGIYV